MGNLLTIAHPETGTLLFDLFNKYVAFCLHCPEWVIFVPLGNFLEERQSGVTGQCKEQIQKKGEEKRNKAFTNVMRGNYYN